MWDLVCGEAVDHIDKHTDGNLEEQPEESLDKLDHDSPLLGFNNIPPPGRMEYVLRTGRMDIRRMA